MRVLRFLAAVVIWLLATVLMILAIVLSLTILLLPVGLLLGRYALKLYRKGAALLLPRPRDLEKGVRKVGRRWRKRVPRGRR